MAVKVTTCLLTLCILQGALLLGVTGQGNSQCTNGFSSAVFLTYFRPNLPLGEYEAKDNVQGYHSCKQLCLNNYKCRGIEFEMYTRNPNHMGRCFLNYKRKDDDGVDLVEKSKVAVVINRNCPAIEPNELRSCGNSLASYNPINDNHKVVGGHETLPHAWPWMVTFQTQGTWHMCGGALIHPQYVLSAAHCHRYFRQHKVSAFFGVHDIIGKAGANVVHRRIEKMLVHGDYSRNNRDLNDIMLVKLTDPVDYNNDIAPVCLPPANSKIPKDTLFVATGWGTQKVRTNIGPTQKPEQESRRFLQEVVLPYVKNDACSEMRGRIYRSLTPTKMCAGDINGGRDTCKGDSGGPLIRPVGGKWELSGVTSHGDGCGLAGKPGVYMRVNKYIDWITECMVENSANCNANPVTINY